MNCINKKVDEHFQTLFFSDSLEACIANSLKESEVEKIELLNTIVLLDAFQILEGNGWKPKFEELNPPLNKSITNNTQAPKLELK